MLAIRAYTVNLQTTILLLLSNSPQIIWRDMVDGPQEKYMDYETNRLFYNIWDESLIDDGIHAWM
jgi:hypothetical protein